MTTKLPLEINYARDLMIKQYLESRFIAGRLYNSWLIESNDGSKALEELKDFTKEFLLSGALLLENHPDFKLVARQKATNAKNISVEQIRDLQAFLQLTPSMGGYKIAIIYQAELMNLNAANSCLKILEDTPKNTYLFLVTSIGTNILPTIRSRCAKINLHHKHQEDNIKFISMLANPSLPEKLSFLNEFSDKNRELWASFASSALRLINRISKRSVGANVELSKLEHEIMNHLSSTSPLYLAEKFEHIRTLVDNTITYDLDLRASCVLLMEEFRR